MITRHDIAFMVQEIISECHSRPKGAEMIDLIDKYADKFGKDNNGMVLSQDLFFKLKCKFHEAIDCCGMADNSKYFINKVYKRMFGEEYSKWPNNDCGHNHPITLKGDSGYCGGCKQELGKFSQQPPKERKVSLEEISKILICLHEVTGEVYLGNITGTSQAILSLLNATEERNQNI